MFLSYPVYDNDFSISHGFRTGFQSDTWNGVDVGGRVPRSINDIITEYGIFLISYQLLIFVASQLTPRAL
jgi:hypothetical protein